MKKFSFTLSLVLVFLVGFACERELSGTAKKPAETICNDKVDNDGDGLVDCGDPDCDTSRHCNEQGPEVLCDDDIDNDADGAVDCADVDCASATECAVPAENCTNEIDDDRDGLIDCDDPDCASHTACNIVGPEEICDDGLDNDLDGPIDCDDADCAEATNCLPSAEICTDGLDNDQDGFVDCEDVDCASHQACQPVCGNGVIEGDEQCEGSNFAGETCVSRGFDGGSLTCTACIIRTTNCTEDPICGDGLCESGENCPADCESGVEICNNGQDDDGNGWIDCDDAACWGSSSCSSCGNGYCESSLGENSTSCPADCPAPIINCGNGILNSGEVCDGANLNGQTCVSRGFTGGTLACNASCTAFVTTNCTSAVVENCSNGLDDDRDGLIDGFDPSCSWSFTAERNCNDGVDNDSDGYTDCADHDCAAADVCRFGTAGGDTYLVAVPGTGTRNFGGVGMDHPSFWSTARATGRGIVVNVEKYYTALSAYYYGATYTWSTCSPSAIKAFARTPAVDWSVFQLQCVSPTSGACANMAIYVGCTVNPGTGLQTQANFLILMDRNDSAQQAWRNSQMPNGQSEEIASGQSAISMLTWYRGLSPQ